MPKHIAILFILLGSLLILALGARFYLTDSSFYRFGDYRADAVPEIASGMPLFKGAPEGDSISGDYCAVIRSLVLLPRPAPSWSPFT